MAQTTTYDDPVLDHDDQVLELHEAPARPSPRMTSWAGRRLKGVLHAAVIAILLAAVAFLGLRVRSLQANDAGRAGALKAATTFGGIVSSYNYKQPSSFTRAEQMETPQYAKTSASQAADLTKLLIQYKGISEGRVLAAGLSSYSSTHAGVLLFVDQNVSNSVEKTGTANQPLRVEVSLVRGHGRWLVDNLSVPS